MRPHDEQVAHGGAGARAVGRCPAQGLRVDAVEIDDADHRRVHVEAGLQPFGQAPDEIVGASASTSEAVISSVRSKMR